MYEYQTDQKNAHDDSTNGSHTGSANELRTREPELGERAAPASNNRRRFFSNFIKRRNNKSGSTRIEPQNSGQGSETLDSQNNNNRPPHPGYRLHLTAEKTSDKIRIKKVVKYNLFTAAHVIGGMILSVLLLITLSGVGLAFFYLPFPENAYQSVVAISGMPITSYIRNLHYWASDILMVLLIVHLGRIVISKINGKAKKYAYWGGLAMAFLVANEMLIGTFLRADQEAYEAYAHFWVGAKAALPGFLYPIIDFIGQGDTALMRFFIGHAIIIPAALLFFLFLHAIHAGSFRGLIIQISTKFKNREKVSRFPQLKILLISSGILLGIIFILAYIIPAPLMSSPYGGLEITKPPWYLLWVYGLENIFGMKAIIFAPLALAVIFAALPFFSKKEKQLDTAMVIFLVTIMGIIALTFYAALGAEMSHLNM